MNSSITKLSLDKLQRNILFCLLERLRGEEPHAGERLLHRHDGPWSGKLTIDVCKLQLARRPAKAQRGLQHRLIFRPARAQHPALT